MKRWVLVLGVFLIGDATYAQDSVLLARTTGLLPFMEYGIGDDRLGGAKIGYLDSNIVVRIVDSFSTDYKVRLSTYHSAYIAKGQPRPDRQGGQPAGSAQSPSERKYQGLWRYRFGLCGDQPG